MKTIRDLYNFATSQNKKLLGDVTDFDFMQGYVSKSAVYDRAIDRLFNSRFYSSREKDNNDIEELFDDWKTDVYMILTLNAEKYKRYLEINNVEFNPIENYDRYENINITHVGTVEDRTGSVTNNKTMTGSETDTHNHGINESTTTASQTPYDSPVFKDTDKATTRNNAYVDTDSKSFENRADNETQTFNNLKNEIDNADTTTAHIHGNIGVMTATSMMTESLNFWDMFNLYQVIFTDIINQLCATGWFNDMYEGVY